MASFELIGIPSYDGIFRNIILNLLLSDNHHCFTSPSSSSKSATEPKSKSDWCLSMIQNRQNNQGAAAGQRARMCPGIILWPTDCARSASNAERDCTVVKICSPLTVRGENWRSRAAMFSCAQILAPASHLTPGVLTPTLPPTPSSPCNPSWPSPKIYLTQSQSQK